MLCLIVLNIDQKNWRKTDLCFQNLHEEFTKFSPEYVQKSKNWDFHGMFLSKVENKSLKFTGELFVMTIRSNRYSMKTLFYLENKWITQLTKLFTRFLQSHCSQDIKKFPRKLSSRLFSLMFSTYIFRTW